MYLDVSSANPTNSFHYIKPPILNIGSIRSTGVCKIANNITKVLTFIASSGSDPQQAFLCKARTVSRSLVRLTGVGGLVAIRA